MDLKYLVISDVHLGHINTPTEHIVANLVTELMSDDKKDLDVFFLAGDMFDRLLDFNADDVQCVIMFLTTFLSFCASNNIKVRVLEGTSSHDWRQSKNFVNINNSLKSPCDLLYHTSLTIERIKDHNVHVLYIPDNWIYSDEELQKEVTRELSRHNIDKVDIAIMHGHFKYQAVGMHNKEYSFDEEYFLALVRYYVHIGHFHTHSHYERIVAQGSFDRLKHGEEEAKGYVVAEIGKTSGWAFRENKNAYVYKTIRVTPAMDLPKLDKVISKYPRDSYIRLALHSSHPLNQMYDQLKLRYCDCKLTRKLTDKSDEKKAAYIQTDDVVDFSSFVLNEANLTARLRDQIVEKGYDFTHRHWELFNNLLKGLT